MYQQSEEQGFIIRIDNKTIWVELSGPCGAGEKENERVMSVNCEQSKPEESNQTKPCRAFDVALFWTLSKKRKAC